MHEDERETERAKSEKDRQDFNNEIAGRETGQMRRFIPENQTPAAEKARREARDRFFLNVTLSLQARIQQFRERLDDLDRASLRALEAAERRADEAALKLEELRQSATRDPQGRLVYRTADGQTAFFDDGRQLSDEAFRTIEWRTGAPTWEERKRREEEYQREIGDVLRIGSYRDRLDSVRGRLESGDPISEDELRDLEQTVDDLPNSVARELPGRSSISETRLVPPSDAVEPLSASELAELAGFTDAPVPVAPGSKPRR